MQPQFPSGGGETEAIVGIISIIIFLGIGLLFLVLTIAIWWKIFAKAGYSGAMGLLMLIPLVNFIMLLVLAFGEWPIQRELRSLRGQGSG
jgi:hypothetical protein